MKSLALAFALALTPLCLNIAAQGTYVTYRGAWNQTTHYTVNDTISYGGQTWISAIPNNTGNTPVSGSSAWTLFGGGGGSSTSSSASFGSIAGQPTDNAALNNALGGKQAVLGFTPENSANKGQNNGYAPLDSTGKVPAANLPSTSGSVTTPPTITLYKGNGSTNGIVAAVPGTDYIAPTSTGRVTGAAVGAVRMADSYNASNLAGQINACLQAAASGGMDTCDARFFTGTQTLNAQITVPQGTTLLLPSHAYWVWSGLTDGTSAGILQQNGSTVLSNSVGGGGSQMILDAAKGSNMLALWTTDAGANNTAPSGGGSYIYAAGFLAQNSNGATFSHGLGYARWLFDESILTRVMFNNPTGDALHIYQVCCDTSFAEVQAYSQYGSSGGTPIVVEANGNSSFRYSGTANAAGTGHPNIDLETGNGQTEWLTLYAENVPAGGQYPTDTATATFNNASSVPPLILGGHDNRGGTSKPCFSNPTQAGLFSKNWCDDGDVFGSAATATYPGNPHIMVTSPSGTGVDSGIIAYGAQYTGNWSANFAGKYGADNFDQEGPNVRAGVAPDGTTGRIVAQAQDKTVVTQYAGSNGWQWNSVSGNAPLGSLTPSGLGLPDASGSNHTIQPTTSGGLTVDGKPITGGGGSPSPAGTAANQLQTRSADGTSLGYSPITADASGALTVPGMMVHQGNVYTTGSGVAEATVDFMTMAGSGIMCPNGGGPCATSRDNNMNYAFLNAGQNVFWSPLVFCEGVGDCVENAKVVSNAGDPMYNSEHTWLKTDVIEDNKNINFTCTGGCNTGSTSITISGNNGLPGVDRLITGPAYWTGTVTNGACQAPFCTAQLPGRTDAASLTAELASFQNPGTSVQLPIKSTSDYTGIGTSTSGFAVGNIVAISDPGVWSYFEYAKVTAVSSTAITVDSLRYGHNANSIIATGGLVGSCVSQTANDNGTAQQCVPVVASMDGAGTVMYPSNDAGILLAAPNQTLWTTTNNGATLHYAAKVSGIDPATRIATLEANALPFNGSDQMTVSHGLNNVLNGDFVRVSQETWTPNSTPFAFARSMEGTGASMPGAMVGDLWFGASRNGIHPDSFLRFRGGPVGGTYQYGQPNYDLHFFEPPQLGVIDIQGGGHNTFPTLNLFDLFCENGQGTENPDCAQMTYNPASQTWAVTGTWSPASTGQAYYNRDGSYVDLSLNNIHGGSGQFLGFIGNHFARGNAGDVNNLWIDTPTNGAVILRPEGNQISAVSKWGINIGGGDQIAGTYNLAPWHAGDGSEMSFSIQAPTYVEDYWKLTGAGTDAKFTRFICRNDGKSSAANGGCEMQTLNDANGGESDIYSWTRQPNGAAGPFTLGVPLTLSGSSLPIAGAATQPTGSCSIKSWTLSDDGHLTYCDGSNYQSKL